MPELNGETTGLAHVVALVRERVTVQYTRADQSAAHRMDHIERVLANARAIAVHFPEADMEILTLAALLHDVTSPFDRKEQHVKLSINTAKRILNGIRYPPERAERVLAIIAEHSTDDLKAGDLSSVEARILFDADKIDGMGPCGIARAFTQFGQRGRAPPVAVTWYRKKIETAVRNMKTDPGRAMAEERLPYLRDFLHRFDEENDPEPAGGKPTLSGAWVIRPGQTGQREGEIDDR